MMIRRTDYLDDPTAPAPNTIVPGGAALITDTEGRILLQRRTDSGNWSLPGGTMELGETLGNTVIREVHEETGLHITLTGILGIYTNPHHIIAYTDGEIRQEFVIVFIAQPTGGHLRLSDESTDLRYIHPNELANLPIHESVRLRISHWTAQRPSPYIG